MTYIVTKYLHTGESFNLIYQTLHEVHEVINSILDTDISSFKIQKFKDRQSKSVQDMTINELENEVVKIHQQINESPCDNNLTYRLEQVLNECVKRGEKL